MLRLTRLPHVAFRPPLLHSRPLASAAAGDGGSRERRGGGPDRASGPSDVNYDDFFKGSDQNRRSNRTARAEAEEDSFRDGARFGGQGGRGKFPPPPRGGGSSKTDLFNDPVGMRQPRRGAKQQENDDAFLKRFMEGAGGAENASDPDFVARFLREEVSKDKAKRGTPRRAKKKDDDDDGRKRDRQRGDVTGFGGMAEGAEGEGRRRRTSGPARYLEDSDDEGGNWGRDREDSEYGVDSKSQDDGRSRRKRSSMSKRKGDEEEDEDGEEGEGEDSEQGLGKTKRKSTSMYAGRIFERDDDTLRRGYHKPNKYKLELEESETEEDDDQLGEKESSGDSEDDEEIDEEEFEEVMQKLRREYPMETEELERDPEAMEEMREDFPTLMKELREEEEEEEEAQKRQQGVIPRIVLSTEKEEMWKLHKEDPEQYTVEKLAERYRICKARAHAILWLWELRKQGGEEVKSPEEEDAELRKNLAFNSDGEDEEEVFDVNLQKEDRWETMWGTKPNYKIMPEDWEGSVRTEKEVIDEVSRKEEEMMLKEFEQRMEFNKLQIAGFIKNHIYSRRRPVDGWTYIVEEMGAQNRRGKHGGGYRFVANSDGTHRPLNELEKIFLRRESVRPRRRIV